MNIPENVKNRAGFEEALETFLEIEDSRGLLFERENGISWWELVRYDLYKKILSEKGVQHTEKKQVKITAKLIWDCIRLFFISLTGKCPLKAPRNAVVFIGHPRKKREGDAYVDIYTEPFLKLAPAGYKYAVLERPLATGLHYQPCMNKDLWYLDALLNVSALIRGVFLSGLSKETKECCGVIREEFSENLGISIDVEKYVRKATGRWRSEVIIFKWLFRKLRPRAIFIVVSAGNESVVAAARLLNIPTAEIQHGAPSRGKLHYDYPKDRIKQYFPDYFLSFGKAWTQNVSLPLPDENIIPIGFPYMQIKRQDYEDVQKKDQIIVLSQPTIGEFLSGFVIDLMRHLGGRVPVLYKIHPQEYENWQSGYQKLEDAGVRLLDHNSDLYQCLAESRWQIGVYSTALYEGLAFSCRTFIVNCSGAEYMKPLIEGGFATLVDSVEEINLESDTGDPPRPELFPEVTPGTIADALQRIITGGRDAA